MVRNVPTEDEEQQTVVQYCDALKLPVFHIPNGGHRHMSVAVQMKRIGVKAGVPDLFMPLAKGEYHGLFIEMKRRNFTPSKLTDNQREWIALLKKNGYAAFVCAGAESAIKCIDWYTKQELIRNRRIV